MLDYASYFGGSNAETALGVTTDSAGNVYITGRTASSDGPVSSAVSALLPPK